MKKVFKRLVRVFVVILSFLLLILVVSFINHRIQLSKEDEDFIPNGQMVEVNGYNMHVYTEGDGEETLVFLSGGGTSSPVLDFKSLYSLLSDDYKIVVVEKAGYGFSQVTNSDRDLDTILSETRSALSQVGIKGPYILMPHSMSGIEALYWAQVYPDEVKAIIGLDMAIPTAYEHMEIQMPFIHLGSFAAKLGLTRWIPSLSESDAIEHGTLTDAEKDLYQLILHRRTSTKNMINEVQMIQRNAKQVQNKQQPSIPMLLLASNGEGTGWDQATWIKFQKEFVGEQENATLIEYDVSHYLHNIEYERISSDVKSFLIRLDE